MEIFFKDRELTVNRTLTLFLSLFDFWCLATKLRQLISASAYQEIAGRKRKKEEMKLFESRTSKTTRRHVEVTHPKDFGQD